MCMYNTHIYTYTCMYNIHTCTQIYSTNTYTVCVCVFIHKEIAIAKFDKCCVHCSIFRNFLLLGLHQVICVCIIASRLVFFFFYEISKYSNKWVFDWFWGRVVLVLVGSFLGSLMASLTLFALYLSALNIMLEFFMLFIRSAFNCSFIMTIWNVFLVELSLISYSVHLETLHLIDVCKVL